MLMLPDLGASGAPADATAFHSEAVDFRAREDGEAAGRDPALPHDGPCAKRIDDAEKHFEIVLSSDPRNFNAKFNMGLVEMERHHYTEAISLLNQAVAIDSSRPVARLWIGIAKLELGEMETAEAELTRALIMGGAECVAANYHLARIFLSRGDVTEAARSVQSYIQLAPRGEFITEAKELAQKIGHR